MLQPGPGSTLFLCLTLFAGQYVAPLPNVQAAWTIYAASLSRACGEKHLENVSASDLVALAGSFTDRLPAGKQRDVKSAVGLSCRNRREGRDCEIDGFIQAATQLNEIDRFAAHVCESRK